MGIDIYCGTMTRYYSGDWDSEGKRYCLENGLEYKVIRPNSDEADDDEALSSEEIEELVLAWRASIIKDASKLRGKSFSPWQENRDMPYLTNRFDMGAFGAFFIAYSSIYYEKKYPKAIDITKSFYEYPIVKKTFKKSKSVLLADIDIWLPIDDSILFNYCTVYGDDCMIGTVTALKNELDSINKKLWKADEQTILSWLEQDIYIPSNKSLFDRIIGNKEIYEIEPLFKYSFAMFYKYTSYALEYNLPIKLDY